MRLNISADKWLKVAKGAAIAAAGAALTYLSEAVTQLEFGELTPVVVAGFSVAVNAARKWLQENREPSYRHLRRR